MSPNKNNTRVYYILQHLSIKCEVDISPLLTLTELQLIFRLYNPKTDKNTINKSEK